MEPKKKIMYLVYDSVMKEEVNYVWDPNKNDLYRIITPQKNISVQCCNTKEQVEEFFYYLSVKIIERVEVD